MRRDCNHIGIRMRPIRKNNSDDQRKSYGNDGAGGLVRSTSKRWRRWSTSSSYFELWVDSLALAVIVARLEDELALDPFSGSDAAGVPKTVGDFVRAYERAVERAAAEKSTAFSHWRTCPNCGQKLALFSRNRFCSSTCSDSFGARKLAGGN